MNDHLKGLILKIGVGIVVLLFTLFAFVIHPGGSDPFVTENLWEAVHPLKIIDIIGLICFYGGAVMLSGFVKFWNPANSSKWNFINFGILALGLILVWI
jgi:hypothetical protein